MPWFVVRTMIRSQPRGRPRRRDAAYRSGVATIEDRFVLLRAKDFDDALRRGEAEAAEYVRLATVNAYGQRVAERVLGYVEAFSLYRRPVDGDEVFSRIEVVDPAESASQLLDRKLGPKGADTAAVAHMFIDSSIARELGLVQGDEERARPRRARRPRRRR